MLPFNANASSFAARRQRQRQTTALWMCAGCVVLAFLLGFVLYSQLSSGALPAAGIADGAMTSNGVKATLTPGVKAKNEAGEELHGAIDSDDVLQMYSRDERRRLASRYLFVRGYAKSGTSWTKMMIDLHQDIFMFPYELQLGLVDEGVQKATTDPWQSAVEPYKSVVLGWAEQLIFQVMETARMQEPDARYVGEKSPKPVAPLVDGARYVYVLRDGRDVIVSLLAHRVRIGGFNFFCPGDQMFDADDALDAEERHDWAFFEKNVNKLLSNEMCVRQLASHWARRVTADLKILDAYRPELYLILQYEKLVQNADGERRRVYSWLNLDPRKSDKLGLYTMPLAGLSPDSEFRPDNPFFRKGEPGDWRNFFHADAKRWFKTEPGAQQLLQKLGYVENDSW